MRKEPTISIGPGLFRIYSMCVKIRVHVSGQWCSRPNPLNPTHPHPIPPPPPLPSLHKYNKPFSCAGREMSVVLDIASNVSGSAGRA